MQVTPLTPREGRKEQKSSLIQIRSIRWFFLCAQCSTDDKRRVCLWWSSPCFWETHLIPTCLLAMASFHCLKWMQSWKKHPAISVKNFTSHAVKVQTTGHKQTKCDINKVLILGARHKQTCQLNKTFNNEIWMRFERVWRKTFQWCTRRSFSKSCMSVVLEKLILIQTCAYARVGHRHHSRFYILSLKAHDSGWLWTDTHVYRHRDEHVITPCIHIFFLSLLLKH